MTEARLRIYAELLEGVPRPDLQIAFHRSLTELSFFPKIAELLSLAGYKKADAEANEADAAWRHVNAYLRQWGVERMPLRSGGRIIEAPQLDARAEYALRTIGGLWRLNQIEEKSYPFMYRDFCEAYRRGPGPEEIAKQIEGKFSNKLLQGKVKNLADSKRMIE